MSGTRQSRDQLAADPLELTDARVSSGDTQAKIADALGYDRSWLGGLIERKRDPDDGRRHLVSLNPGGKKRLAQLRAISKKVEDDLLASLDTEQRAQLHEILLQLASDHDHRDAPANGKSTPA